MTATLERLTQRVNARMALPEPADRLRLRESCRVSRREVAEIVGVSYEAVRWWERGEANPTAEHAIRYLEVLRMFARMLGETLETREPGSFPGSKGSRDDLDGKP